MDTSSPQLQSPVIRQMTYCWVSLLRNRKRGKHLSSQQSFHLKSITESQTLQHKHLQNGQLLKVHHEETRLLFQPCLENGHNLPFYSWVMTVDLLDIESDKLIHFIQNICAILSKLLLELLSKCWGLADLDLWPQLSNQTISENKAQGQNRDFLKKFVRCHVKNRTGGRSSSHTTNTQNLFYQT